MLTRTLATMLSFALIGAASAACVPQTPHAPLAVRLDDSGAVEILDTQCKMQAVNRVEVIAPDPDTVVDDSDIRLWKVEFGSPSTARTYVVGEPQPGGDEVVAWRKPDPDQRLFAQISTDGGMTLGTGFTLADLADGKVRYHLENMTHEQFLEESKC
ncbi:hypothetical protein IOD16_02440 [Saccharothrix sp. 6-C]|uniref:hypothetical protein n=1 Tax=Saccharothrix sp. 6-C TaxID=2781735 RepID=UPI001916EF6B|nr:hypothetical protein [Saccharothrix sp. 6-C]QQQ77418.1 hypothetical protein IOD16_02440 [Saccharothrix sp. 6-C]